MKINQYHRLIKKLHKEFEASKKARFEHWVVNKIASWPCSIKYKMVPFLNWFFQGQYSPTRVLNELVSIVLQSRWYFSSNHFLINLEAEVYKNTLIISYIHPSKIGLLRGLEESAEDYYYKVDYLETGSESLTAVTGFIPLHARLNKRFDFNVYEIMLNDFNEKWNSSEYKKIRKDYKESQRKQWKRIWKIRKKGN
jgi:hypothetical protein